MPLRKLVPKIKANRTNRANQSIDRLVRLFGPTSQKRKKDRLVQKLMAASIRQRAQLRRRLNQFRGKGRNSPYKLTGLGHTEERQQDPNLSDQNLKLAEAITKFPILMREFYAARKEFEAVQKKIDEHIREKKKNKGSE